MALTTDSKIIGSHVWFFRQGDEYTKIPTNGVCSRTEKPPATDTGWINLGIIEDADISCEETETEIYAPVPGHIVLYDVKKTKAKITIKFTTSEISPFAIEMLLKTANLSLSSTQFNPLEGNVEKKGWLKLQSYDQTDTAVMVLDVFVSLKVTGAMKIAGGELAKLECEALVLHSPLNTGTL